MKRSESAKFQNLDAALDFQASILGGVSRTFALTIPSLPGPLRPPVTNAYLLCRIADTIEDDCALSIEQKSRFGHQFVDCIAGSAASDDFASRLTPLLGPTTLAAERELVSRTAEVLQVTHSFNATQQAALARCVTLMTEGMHRFQHNAGNRGLSSRLQLDEYCYHVAGVVGEMLTELFCEYSPEVARQRRLLMKLAPSFGQGLQMTNILKDIWDDRERNVCWLPREHFDLDSAGDSDLIGSLDDNDFVRGMELLVVQAHGHLRNALSYTLLIPREQRGIRRFCLWALGMAVPTLKNIYLKPGFSSADEVKISRRQVRRIVRRYGLLAGNDGLIRWLFKRASAGLPQSDPSVGLQLEAIVAAASPFESTDQEEPVQHSVRAN
ncbi:MAG: phytoene/squalene synthase family protein [Wenzhouxiangellaceae bacterium]|nr:phytoene/squalene synthase family protein [Wenzhouxiangellaceae bacterium]